MRSKKQQVGIFAEEKHVLECIRHLEELQIVSMIRENSGEFLLWGALEILKNFTNNLKAHIFTSTNMSFFQDIFTTPPPPPPPRRNKCSYVVYLNTLRPTGLRKYFGTCLNSTLISLPVVVFCSCCHVRQCLLRILVTSE